MYKQVTMTLIAEEKGSVAWHGDTGHNAFGIIMNLIDEQMKKGDKVVMSNCAEADKYRGKVWTCRSNEWALPDGTKVVLLEEFSGGFAVEHLKAVQ